MALKKTSLRVVGNEVVNVARISDEEAEGLVLSIYYKLGAAAIDRFSSIITPNYFTVSKYRIVYSAMLKMREESLDIDDTVLQTYIKIVSPSAGEEIYSEFVFSLDGQVKPSNLDKYIETLADRYKARKIQSLVIDCWNQISASNVNPESLVHTLRKGLDEVDVAGVFRAGESVGSLVDARIARLEELRTSTSLYTGIASGFPSVDVFTQGWQDGDLIMIAGATSMGKTALALSSLWASVKMYPEKTFFFNTQEMSAAQIVDRLIAIETGINLLKMRSPRHLNDAEMAVIKRAKERIKDSKLILEDAVLDPEKLIAQWLRALSKYGDDLSMFMLDYLQYSANSNSQEFGYNERVAIAAAVRVLKSFARKVNKPVIALSQITREATSRCAMDFKQRPRKDELDGSSEIEKASDVVLLVHRPVVYFPVPPEMEGKGGSGSESYRRTAEVIIGKQRNGPIGTLSFEFNGACAQYIDPKAERSSENEWNKT